jgi:hypothetical protein
MMPQSNLQAARANVGVDTMPASWTLAPIEVAPAMSAWETIWPVTRVSLPRTISRLVLATASLMLTARSMVKSRPITPLMPDEPNKDMGSLPRCIWNMNKTIDDQIIGYNFIEQIAR